MVSFDWGLDEPPAAPGDGRVALPPADLPEVVELVDQGWSMAPEEPLWVFLPAVWPRTHRTWVVDRSTRWVEHSRDGIVVERVPWSADLYAEVEADSNGLLAEAEVPPRPANRLWLLKPPSPDISVQAVLDRVLEPTVSPDSEIVPSCNPAFVSHAHRTVHGLFR
ncbi:DUF5956 family protein [Kribbella sp. NPDC055110]